MAVTKLMAKILDLVSFLVFGCAILPEQRSRAYIIGIREETNTGDDAGSYVVPSKRGLVNLGQRESSSLIGILNMGEVVVEVVEGRITTCGLVGGSDSHCEVRSAVRGAEAGE